ncbi:MAG: hypothetical protein LBS06_00820 [Treponema sp.]|nr:hypothetical protein [Treponema sp.]
MEKRRPVLLAASLLLPCLLTAQTGRPVIKFTLLQAEGIGIEESRLVETLIRSYLADIGEVITYFDAVAEEDPFSASVNISDSWPGVPDYIFSGNIALDQDGRIFSLRLHNTGTGETGSFTAVYRSSGELLLKARSLLESAFAAGGSERPKPPEGGWDSAGMARETIGARQIPGTWRGETGIEMVRLQRGGRGVAVFSSGAQMLLSWVIDNNTLKIRQISPNSERFFHPLPYDIARQAAEGSEPVVWELSLYEGGMVLRGLRINTALLIEENRVVEFIPGGDIQKVEWTRGSR